ncbi:DNA polymerase III subunit gamma/tau [Candidatus Saccharibacteria bacterium]|nr:DNA polymerase III subunit gamma/tau [Candidatus Saccharibacteria bacterium]MBH1972705.1 DNA polymerase III subunit gamma/tau [Candidatus Saccharibacteria bacterium]MBH1990907.1 DNA polymerase III subunit gamma/tau [Candidatus Saccharibacteria bacterium]
MSRALYRKYRSKSLDEVVGQSHVTDILSRSLKQGKVAHAYLLTGPRGVGKTSIARILAHEINSLEYTDETTHLDIIEIDAASNNGVDDVRQLREKVQIAPVSAKKKVYIIDEVHMLSKPAFNALLKTLEEPPEHVVFILATTDADKLPDTIISRTQQYTFRTIQPEDAVRHLRHIASEEKIAISDEALLLIAQRGGGSFRDSISLLDQLSGLADQKEITRDTIEQLLGLASQERIKAIIAAVLSNDLSAILAQLDMIDASGVQPAVFANQLTRAIRANIVSHPQLLPLLDELLSVPTSSQPHIKLLTVLASQTSQKPKSAPLAVNAPAITAPIAPAHQGSIQNMVKQKPVTKIKEDTPTPSTPPQTLAVKPPEAPKVPSQPPGEFDWAVWIEYVRVNYVALHSVLSKCSYEIDGDTLTLYAMRKFNKTKLDDAKYRAILAESLLAVGAGEWIIETIPTPPPPKDSVAAAVAGIMGGGEEVSVDA